MTGAQDAPQNNPGKEITCQLVPQDSRLSAIAGTFGVVAVFFEMRVYDWMQRLSAEYRGGYWHYYRLSNAGFYMAPNTDASFRMVNPANWFDDVMSADAAGIAVCLFAMSHLSFEHPDSALPEQFHRLREYAAGHAEAATIFRLID